jgi:hypothetical protein
MLLSGTLLSSQKIDLQRDFAADVSQSLDWREVSHVGIFDPALITVAFLTFSLVQPPPPVPVSKYSICRQCVAGGGWWALSPVRDHIPQEFNLGGEGASDR